MEMAEESRMPNLGRNTNTFAYWYCLFRTITNVPWPAASPD